MVPGLVELVFAYGLAFGAMNKLPDAFYSRLPKLLLRMLSCAYCTGFHAGWLSYFAISHDDLVLHHAPIWAFTSGAFSYLADATAQAIERRAHVP